MFLPKVIWRKKKILTKTRLLEHTKKSCVINITSQTNSTTQRLWCCTWCTFTEFFFSESIQFFSVIENSTSNKTLQIRGADNATYCSLFLLVCPLNSGGVLSINNNWGKYDLTKIMDFCNYNRVRLITDCYAGSSDTPDNIRWLIVAFNSRLWAYGQRKWNPSPIPLHHCGLDYLYFRFTYL